MQKEEEIFEFAASEGGSADSDDGSDSQGEDYSEVVTQIVDAAIPLNEEHCILSAEEVSKIVSWLEKFAIDSIFELLGGMGGCGDHREEVSETQKWVEKLPSTIHTKAFNDLRQMILLRGHDDVSLEEIQRFLQSVYFPSIEEVLNPVACAAPLDIRRGLYLITRTPSSCACLVRPNVKAQLTSVTSQVSQPENLPYFVASSDKGGKGMFASQDIKEDDLILIERPMVVLPDMIVFLDPNATPHSDLERAVGEILEAYRESVLRTMLDSDEDLKKAFEGLTHCHSTGNLLSDIFQTNAMLLTDLVDRDRALVDERGSGHGGVFKDASRLNHSCAPNVKLNFDTESFTLKLRAARGIKQGEELFFMYAGSQVESAQERRMILERHWGFICTCERCAPSV